MYRFSFTQSLGIIATVLALGLLAGCSGDSEELPVVIVPTTVALFI